MSQTKKRIWASATVQAPDNYIWAKTFVEALRELRSESADEICIAYDLGHPDCDRTPCKNDVGDWVCKFGKCKCECHNPKTGVDLLWWMQQRLTEFPDSVMVMPSNPLEARLMDKVLARINHSRAKLQVSY
jgi:hypothetical protein